MLTGGKTNEKHDEQTASCRIYASRKYFENHRLTILPITLLLLMLGISQMAFTQNTGLTGKIVDEKGTPLRFANIALLRSTDSTLVTGIITDSTGQFNMPAPAPRYLLTPRQFHRLAPT
jgi:hypothetical protein